MIIKHFYIFRPPVSLAMGLASAAAHAHYVNGMVGGRGDGHHPAAALHAAVAAAAAASAAAQRAEIEREEVERERGITFVQTYVIMGLKEFDVLNLVNRYL